ncbi:MAG: hypothetical protein QM541_00605 [Flavobacterium sp.]|nr:hypothetical protein [Flavobacterium sp.]
MPLPNIYNYTIEEFINQIFTSNNELTTKKEIANNSVFKYISGYFQKAKIRYFLLEKEYISIDYITDYSAYYSKCFKNYGNKCVRIHLFSFQAYNTEDFKKELTKNLLAENNAKDSSEFWKKNYLGFIVIRPIPKFFIGYSILNHYDALNIPIKAGGEIRHYWGVKRYKITVLGKSVTLDSLAFMSQDSNVGACATIAIWTMLQRAVENYFVCLKSPYEITKDAGLTKYDGNRIFPNSGLDPVSICTAITKNNLATEIRYFANVKVGSRNEYLKGYINAYSKISLPIILGIELEKGGATFRHAVAVCGHTEIEINEKVKSNIEIPKYLLPSVIAGSEKKLIVKSRNINKVYAHDDQIGPFSKFTFRDKDKITTYWNTNEGYKKCRVIALIVTVFEKIRIPFEEIESRCINLDKFFKRYFEDAFQSQIEWDIKLQYGSDFKEEIKKSAYEGYTDEEKQATQLQILSKPLPKYLWIISLFVNKIKVFDFIFDASGLRKTNVFENLYGYSKTVKRLLESCLTKISTKNNKEEIEFTEELINEPIELFINKIINL